MTVVFSPKAQADYCCAAARYRARSVAAHERFERAVDAAVARIASHPRQFPILAGRFRYGLLTRFPYVLAFTETTDAGFEIVAVAHTARDPEEWLPRG